MRLTAVRTIGVCLSLYVATALGGCYESLEPEPQAQQPSAPAETGPITSLTTQGGGSALGGARRTAGNIVDRVEQQSQQTAEMADQMFDE